MKLTNDSDEEFDFFLQRPHKCWLKWNPKETKNLDYEKVKAIYLKFPYWRWKLEKKDIAYITKDPKKGITVIHLKDGNVIEQRNPEETRFEDINKHLDMRKVQIGIFMKHIPQHYSGGRYWAWLLGHILAEHEKVQVTFIVNILPQFGDSFCDYDTEDLFIYESDPQKLYYMGGKIPVNVFDYIIGIPQEGGNSAMNYANKWGVPFFSLLYESPNFTRDYRGGRDSEDAAWTEYVPVLTEAKRVINNTEIGKDYLDKWELMKEPYDPKTSTWLWNSINFKAADEVNQDANYVDGVYHVVWVGRMIDFKGTQHIIRALNLIPEYKFVVHIISGNSGKIIDNMKREAKEHIEIEFHHKVDDHEKFRIIKLSNMMIFLSRFEGFGMPPMEALYCERLCFAYELPVLKMIYKDNLIWSKQSDFKNLADNIKTYLTDKDKREKHIAKAKKYCDKTFNHNVVRRKFLEIVGYDGHKEVDVSKIKTEDTSFVGHKRILTFGIIVCNGAQFIIQQLEHIYEMANQIIIVEGAVDIFNKIIGLDYSNDETINLIREFKEHRDPKNKIEFVTCKGMGRAWKDKLEMQNKIAELTKGTIFIKQDVDEFYDLKKLMVEINKLEKDPGKIMINYQSLHFWKDYNHVITGANFNDKQTRVWKWKPTYRYLKTFNWVTDTATNKYVPPDAGNMFVSKDKLFHYSYIFGHKSRSNILKYYELRGIGKHPDVSNAWFNKDAGYFKEGRKVEKVNLNHPVSDSVLKSFLK